MNRATDDYRDGYRRELEQDWQSLVLQLERLPPWFRSLMFLVALRAEQTAGWRRQVGTLFEAVGKLWYDALDPADRAALEEYAEVFDDPRRNGQE